MSERFSSDSIGSSMNERFISDSSRSFRLNGRFVTNSSGSFQSLDRTASLNEKERVCSSHRFSKNVKSEIKYKRHNGNKECKECVKSLKKNSLQRFGEGSSDGVRDLRDQKVKETNSDSFPNLIDLGDNENKSIQQINDQITALNRTKIVESESRGEFSRELLGMNESRDVDRDEKLVLNENRVVDRTEQLNVATTRETRDVSNGRDNGVVDQSEDGGQLMIIILIYEDFFIILVLP